MAGTAAVPVAVPHADQARARVSSTAIGVAVLRAFESRKPEGERLFSDPFAEVLVGDPDRVEPWWDKNRGLGFWVDFLAARTRHIDDRVAALALAEPEMQLVIVGAGLDTRAYRLEALRGKQVFEVDFAEVLTSKAALLASSPPPLAQRATVAADLSTREDWTAALLAAGYRPAAPSLWLLEGLTGYLTEPELQELFKGIAGAVGARASMLVTFLGRAMVGDALDLHRYFVRDREHVPDVLKALGWRARRVNAIHELAEGFGRGQHIPPGHAYFIAEAERGSSPL